MRLLLAREAFVGSRLRGFGGHLCRGTETPSVRWRLETGSMTSRWGSAMAIWISKFLGPLILVLSIRMITSPTGLNETTRRYLADRPLVLISGVLAMTAGLSIVNTHNIWTFRWPVIVTVFGWLLLFGGAIRVAAPQMVDRVGGAMMERAGLTRFFGILWAVLGAFLTWKGYR
jgi:hypothetical protein